MLNPPVTRERFMEILPYICDEETSSDPAGWRKENPLWGQCAVVSLLAQNIFGGELLRASLSGTPFAEMRSHYWNVFSDKTMEDFTAGQFKESYPITGDMVIETRSRQSVLFHPITGQPQEIMKRYKRLAWKFARDIYPNNALLENRTYEECFNEALESTCQKMWFGCVVRHRGGIIAQTHNQAVPELQCLCEPTCTEPILGACGHAEEFAIWEAVQKKIPLSECDLFIAGFFTNGLPWLKTQAEYTCLRCAVQMKMAGVESIWVPVQNHWEMISPAEALKGAITKQKEAGS
ncbi:MAG: hypothetical protein Q8P76_03610 [bacterium]|nr:hypothetical protein [bacterium]